MDRENAVQLGQSVYNKSGEKEINHINLSDGTTKLVHLLSALNDYDEFSKFLKNLEDTNATVPHDSPFWPGCSALHLAVIKGTKFWVELLENSNSQRPVGNHTDEEFEYWERIDLCLTSGCSATTKNAEGLTPIHLAFKLCDKQVTDLLLSRCDDNLFEPDQISFFHIACATGNADVVTRLLDKGADINSQTSVSFEWFVNCCLKNDEPDDLVFPVNSTALHIAAVCQNKEVVEILMNMGANMYAQNALGLTPIHLSIIKSSCYLCNEKKVIAQLLLKKAPALRELVSNSGLSHLHVAAYADDANAIDKLVQMGADIDRVFEGTEPELSHLAEYANRTPLHVAILLESYNAIYTLVKSGADILQETPEKETPLQMLLFDPHHETSEVIDYINNKFPELCHMNEATDVNGTTSLHAACAALDFEWTKKLLENGADPNAQMPEDSHGDCIVDEDSAEWSDLTPIHTVIWSVVDNEDEQRAITANSLIKLLIEHGADPLILCEGRYSPLLFAYEFTLVYPYESNYYGTGEDSDVFFSIADVLLKHQENYQVNPVNEYGFSHFHYACMRNQVDIVKKFLDNGIDVNHTANIELPASWDEAKIQDATNFTPLHFAAYYKHVEVARLLIERGANVNAVNEDEETPLHIAVKQQHVDLNLLKILLSNGATIKVREGQTLMSEFLWHARDITHEQFKFLKTYTFSIDITKENYGLIGLAMIHAKPSDREAIFEEIIKYHAIKNATKNHNLIESIVDISEQGELDLDFYIRYIQRLIGMGCDIDEQNEQGETAVHTANYRGNVEAIEALLLLGANINIVDVDGITPINIMYHDFEREGLIRKMLAAHVWKMKVAGLKVHNQCETCMLNVHEEFPLDENFVRQCEDELGKLSKEDIGQSLTLKSFLHEWSGIIEYPTMPGIQREYVDQVFADSAHLRKSFPQFSGLLTMQYRKAVDRLKLHEVAMDLLPSVLLVHMPYLCFENILKYFDNDELKYFVEGHQDLVSVDEQMHGLSV